MKYLTAIVLIIAVASAKVIDKPINLFGPTEPEMVELQEILDAIYSPSTDPTTAVMLEQMLHDQLGLSSVRPTVLLPPIIIELEPIHIESAIIEEFEPINTSPEIVDFPVFEDADTSVPEAQDSGNSPLLQIIMNGNKQVDSTAASSVQFNEVDESSPVVVENLEQSIIEPIPANTMDQAEESVLKPISVVDEKSNAQSEPVVIDNMPESVDVDTAVFEPETLN